jgi:hypothetical protein
MITYSFGDFYGCLSNISFVSFPVLHGCSHDFFLCLSATLPTRRGSSSKRSSAGTLAALAEHGLSSFLRYLAFLSWIGRRSEAYDLCYGGGWWAAGYRRSVLLFCHFDLLEPRQSIACLKRTGGFWKPRFRRDWGAGCIRQPVAFFPPGLVPTSAQRGCVLTLYVSRHTGASEDRRAGLSLADRRRGLDFRFQRIESLGRHEASWGCAVHRGSLGSLGRSGVREGMGVGGGGGIAFRSRAEDNLQSDR